MQFLAKPLNDTVPQRAFASARVWKRLVLADVLAVFRS